MKLKYLFPSVLMAMSLAFVACGDDDDNKSTDPQPEEFKGVVLSPTSLDFDGIAPSQGAIIALTATADWKIEAENADWLTITPKSGGAGQNSVAIQTYMSSVPHATVLRFVCDGKTVELPVKQAKFENSSTCKEIIEGADSAEFVAVGKVKEIKNTVYGNWYLEDETGEIYIYGTLDKDGNAGKNNSLEAYDIAVGDLVAVKGVKKTYKETVELVNVKVVGHVKLSKMNNEEDESQSTEGHGLSADDPFTVAEALAEAGKLEQGAVSEKDYFVKGKISNIKYTFDANYGTATFSITEDGNESDNTFLCYGCYYLGNTSWQDGDTQIELGDEVIVCGKFTNYNGTLETKSKMNYIYSLNGKTK